MSTMLSIQLKQLTDPTEERCNTEEAKRVLRGGRRLETDSWG